MLTAKYAYGCPQMCVLGTCAPRVLLNWSCIGITVFVNNPSSLGETYALIHVLELTLLS